MVSGSAAPARLRVLQGVGHGFVHKPSTAIESAAAEDAFATLLRFLRWSYKFASAESADTTRDSIDDVMNNQGAPAIPDCPLSPRHSAEKTPTSSNRRRTTSAGYDDLGGKESEDLMRDIDASKTPYSLDEDSQDEDDEGPSGRR